MAAAARYWPLAGAAVCLVLVVFPILAAPAIGYNDSVFKNALAVFAVLRTINAALSVLKETEVGLAYVGSVTTQPAMILDPIDETVARVADAVFVLAVMSGVLTFAFTPLSRLGAGLACAGFLLMGAARHWPRGRRFERLGRSLAAMGLVFALALPVGYGLGGWLGQIWTEDALSGAYDELSGSAEILSATAQRAAGAPVAEAPAPRAEPAPEDVRQFGGSLMAPLLEGYDRARAAVDGMTGQVARAGSALREAVPDMAKVQARGGEILESSLTIVAIYTFRLVLLPLALLWLVWAVAGRAFAHGVR